MISLKTTGLQFGYFFGLLFFIVFLVRGLKEDKISDKLLGFVMFFMAMLLQDYTFGFAGINFLWEELDGWPRHFPWIFPASVYFYFLAQTNIDFKFNVKHIYHVIPYVIYLLISFIFLGLGMTPMKNLPTSNISMVWEIFLYIINYGGIFYYFFKSLKIYKNYKIWTENQYSNTFDVSLIWLKNFLMFYLVGAIIHLFFAITDYIYKLSFDDDYYWQLFTVVTIIYVGLSGITQKQEISLSFKDEDVKNDSTGTKDIVKDPTQEELDFKDKLFSFMVDRKPYLNPDLTLKELASILKTNPAFLSGVINNVFGKNFNDFINEFRVQTFQEAIQESENKNLTLIAIGYDCGFNSKATFNRAIKKFTGKMPSELK